METNNAGVEAEIVEKASSRQTFKRWSQDGRVSTVEELIVRELPITLFVDGQEVVTMMCTPTKETYLIAGFLYLEGIIGNIDDVLFMRVCAEESVADVRLRRGYSFEKARRTLTSGCGGGTTFIADLHLAPVEATMVISPEQVARLMVALLQRAGVYRQTGGVHTSALTDGEELLVAAEDVGRHNTIDKIAGQCFLNGIPTAGRALLATGRISSEMLVKAAKMAVPIVISHSSPTDLAVQLARELNITLVGYARGRSFNVYSHDWRIS